MIIDKYLPQYDVCEQHKILIAAPIERVYKIVRELDITEARVTKLLFRLRGIPASSRFSLDNFIKMRFALLGEQENEELLLGLIGKFWTPSGKLIRTNAREFQQFNQPGYAKAVWNFHLCEASKGQVVLTTETRVYCLDNDSRRSFKFYWFFIGAFSKFIRTEILRTIKKNAEQRY